MVKDPTLFNRRPLNCWICLQTLHLLDQGLCQQGHQFRPHLRGQGAGEVWGCLLLHHSRPGFLGFLLHNETRKLSRKHMMNTGDKWFYRGNLRKP